MSRGKMWSFLSSILKWVFWQNIPLLIAVVVRIIVYAVTWIFSKTHALLIKVDREEGVRIDFNEAKLSAERSARERAAREERVRIEAKVSAERAAQERAAAQVAAQAAEFARVLRRDADVQDTPYKYVVGAHANESLAIRYGIANQVRKTKEYWYHGRGGEKLRNTDRDKVYYEPSSEIRLQKVRKVGDARYEVLLTEFRDRRAIAVIEPGTEYVKTFLPLDEQWFSQNADLELTLKGNGTFNLKELARIHIDKAVGRKA